jgi:hypothetical protein
LTRCGGDPVGFANATMIRALKANQSLLFDLAVAAASTPS